MLKPFVGIFVKPVNFEASRDKNCHGNMKMALKKLDNRPLHYLTRLALTATIYTNFMSDFEQTIQQSYHDHFLLQKIWERKTITETILNVRTLAGKPHIGSELPPF